MIMCDRALAILWLLLLITPTAADIIEDDVIFGGGPASYGFSLGQSIPDGEGLLAFSFDLQQNGDIVVSYDSIAELVAIYEVEIGTFFDTSYALSNDPLSINDNTFNNGIIQVPVGESFFVAYFDDRAYWESGNPFGVDDQDNFGWAEIRRTNNGLELLGSATRLNGGIVAGSTTKIPEPVVFPVLAATCLLASSRKRWH